jgi:TonB-dependent SusC/RagA subfamily outer membrane receptor
LARIAALLLLLLHSGVASVEARDASPNAQEIVVTGTVTDDEGSALPGVNILQKDTNQGVVTDIDGRYAITLSTSDVVLVYSYVGYLNEEVAVGNQSVIDVSLSPDVTSLDEIVVVGYGTAKKSDLTGAVASADIEAFRESPNVNIMQSLQGSVPGVQIGQVNQAGEEPNIQIRGQTSIDGNQDPLIVLDGIIYRGRIGDINPADIKSVDILKDASSQAIYGAQAGNGVILITTKGGKSGRKPTINYSGSFSTQTPSNDARLLNREEVLQKVRDVMYRDSYLAPDYTEPNPAWDFSQSELLPALLTGIDNGNDYDWWGALT